MNFNLRDPQLVSIFWRNAGRLPDFYDEGSGIYRVKSRSIALLWHIVTIEGDEGHCTCWSNFNGTPCTHLSVVGEYHLPDRFYQESRIEYYQDIRSRLSSDPKLLKKYRRVYAQSHAESRSIVETVGIPF